jgi:hypothetical protein
MKYSIIVILYLVTFVSLAQSDSPVIGGWEDSKDEERSEVNRIAQEISSQLAASNSNNPAGEYTLVSVNSFQSQVVAGINYRFEATYAVDQVKRNCTNYFFSNQNI